MNEQLSKRTQEYRSFVENYLLDYYKQYRDQPQTQLFEAMEYSLMAGGKRLRPIFTLEFCRMCGADWQLAAPFAAAVEMIQTYSLIHDDLPCMDDDDYRRGRPTNHKVYGEAMAVLAGDALLTDAFMVAASAEHIHSSAIGKAVALLAKNSGSLGMVGGQVLDISSEDRVLSEREVLDIQSRKTGALIHAACVLGVLAAGGTEEQLDAAGRFARALGLAFQIRDDILDVIGDPEEMGKAVGTDQVKNTFVRLYGLEKAEALVQAYTAEALDALSVFPDREYLRQLSLELVSRTV
jgi:geranylgeranyl diphosphate synthase type II